MSSLCNAWYRLSVSRNFEVKKVNIYIGQTTYLPLFTFVDIWTTTYLPPLVNVVCERPLMHSVWYICTKRKKKQRNLDLIVLTFLFFVLQIRWWFGFGSRSHDWPTRKVVNSNALLFWTAVYTSSTARARASEYTGTYVW